MVAGTLSEVHQLTGFRPGEYVIEPALTQAARDTLAEGASPPSLATVEKVSKSLCVKGATVAAGPKILQSGSSVKYCVTFTSISSEGVPWTSAVDPDEPMRARFLTLTLSSLQGHNDPATPREWLWSFSVWPLHGHSPLPYVDETEGELEPSFVNLVVSGARWEIIESCSPDGIERLTALLELILRGELTLPPPANVGYGTTTPTDFVNAVSSAISAVSAAVTTAMAYKVMRDNSRQRPSPPPAEGQTNTAPQRSSSREGEGPENASPSPTQPSDEERP
ncbi:hypothetical protein QFZ76_009951 [Streptomyces sp. V4I2]|nr:hypothetical protein [Streptomyces sp. V4I2]